MKEGLFARTGLQCNELLTEGYDSIECEAGYFRRNMACAYSLISPGFSILY